MNSERRERGVNIMKQELDMPAACGDKTGRAPVTCSVGIRVLKLDEALRKLHVTQPSGSRIPFL